MSTTETAGSDEQRLAELGYAQELRRGWSGFSNFAISFSIISVLAGCFTSYGQAFNNGGPVAISIGWPIISLLILCVAFSMSELASAFPTAGGIYFWASRLGGAGWGWFTGWFNLIGLVAVVASVDYAVAGFAHAILGLYNAHIVFNWGPDVSAKYFAHTTFALFLLILLIHGLINVFSGHLVSIFNGISVWWHVVGVAAIIVLLVVVPSHHASVSYVFGTRYFGTFNHGMYWFYVLPLGFLLTMYTITGYDASAHVSEETRGAAESAPKGVWRSVFYSAVIGWLLLLALTFCVQKAKVSDIAGGLPWGYPAINIFTTALSSWAAKLVIIIATVGQLFCGMACVTSASRMTFAFSRDGAIPGHRLWRRIGPNATPTYAVLFVCVFAALVTVPAFFPNKSGVPVAFFAVTSIAVIGLYIAYAIPIFLRWRMGDAFETGPWTLGRKYRWINPIAFVWVGLCTIIFCLPVTDPEAVYFKKGFDWNAVNYAPLVTLGVMGAVTIWYLVSARTTFTGPIKTVQFADDGVTIVDPDARPI